jgi:hypothetical protein
MTNISPMMPPGPFYGGNRQTQASPFAGMGNLLSLVGPALQGFGAALAADVPRVAPLVTGNALQASGKRRTNNQTYNWIKNRYPDIAAQRSTRAIRCRGNQSTIWFSAPSAFSVPQANFYMIRPSARSPGLGTDPFRATSTRAFQSWRA